MTDQPGRLYLGREFDIDTQRPTDEIVSISARELTTHAVCLGMTGTGKTGLGIVLLEELLLQDTPLIIIDPKGDITNLVLAFPDLAPGNFRPWIDEEEANRQRISPDELAARTAQRWREGLAASDIPPERVRQLKDRTDFRIFTPGSGAGIAVNILQGFNPPDSGLNWTQNAEALRERIAQLCSALLQLVGIEADPMRSREHILLATLFESAWRAGQPVDVGTLIQMIQTPPIRKVGAFDMDVFYPKQDRFELAMALNNLSAAPSFGAWQQGAALEVKDLLARTPGGPNPAGKVRANIFYLAHLSEEERQFFVTLLLSQMVLWMRTQSGTSSLRALIYFDEVFGYCPPFPRNPPTKQPIMTIIKQGRAAGLGLFLATQNPADLDYKGLANIGTWFIGRLRTGRDRDRALEGLEGAGAGFDRETFEKPLSMLPPRTFLLQSASGDPRFFQTRWAMSYLRGPMTRDQVAGMNDGGRQTTDDRRPSVGYRAPLRDEEVIAPTRAAFVAPVETSPSVPAATQPLRPQLPPDVRELFLMDDRPPTTASERSSVVGGRSSAVYRPALLASASVRITDRGSGVMEDERYTYVLPLEGVVRAPDFAQAEQWGDFDPNTLTHEPEPNVPFAALPSGITGRWLKQCEKALVEHIYRYGIKQIFFNRTLKMYGQIGESGLDFRQRCEGVAREKRDAEARKVRAQIDRRMAALQDKLAREKRELVSDRSELSARKREELLTNAESLVNFVLGRRDHRMVSWGAWKRRQTQQAERDVQESQEIIDRLNIDLQNIANEYQETLSQISDKWTHALGDIQEMPLAPKKSDIFADLVALVWIATM